MKNAYHQKMVKTKHFNLKSQTVRTTISFVRCSNFSIEQGPYTWTRYVLGDIYFIIPIFQTNTIE